VCAEVLADGNTEVSILLVVFLGRRHVAGISPGARIVVEGMVGDHGPLGHPQPCLPDHRRRR
jgi:hypothetical protein